MSLHTLALKARLRTLEARLTEGGKPIEHGVTDLLADLYHLCGERGLEYHKLESLAYQHYLHERFGINL